MIDAPHPARAEMPVRKPYTVVILNLDRTDAFVDHVYASDPRDAYETTLRTLWGEAQFGDMEFNLDEAEADRPLLAVFSGHLMSLI